MLPAALLASIPKAWFPTLQCIRKKEFQLWNLAKHYFEKVWNAVFLVILRILSPIGTIPVAMVGNDCCKPSRSKRRSTAEGVKDIPGLINEARVALTDGRQQGHLSVSGPAGSLLTGGSGKHMVTDPRKEEHYPRGAYTQVLMHMIPDSIGVCNWIDSRDEVSVMLLHVLLLLLLLLSFCQCEFKNKKD